jgi:hypothetical protein
VQVTNRKRKAKEQQEAQIKKQARTAGAREKAEETASHSLCTSLTSLDIQLKARNNNKESRIAFLKEQTYARIAGEQPRFFPTWDRNGGKQEAKYGLAPPQRTKPLKITY